MTAYQGVIDAVKHLPCLSDQLSKLIFRLWNQLKAIDKNANKVDMALYVH